MSYVSLARKYRPRRFVDMVGQESTTLALTNAIRLRREPHSVIFTGVRGIGKTTSARIYAKALNCEQGPTPDPCDVCASCQAITVGNHEDVLEIDGASNTGVDDVRALQETLSYVPQRSTYKIYIIDEVHMLSISAFNALLKTLEEPPQHVIFIFATTELHKVPETIQSRCQVFHLQKISRPVIAERIRSILNAEAIPFEEDALTIVAREGRGSMRDALTMLDQAIAVGGGEVSLGTLRNMVGGSQSQALPVLELLDGLLRKDAALILEVIARWDQEGLAMAVLVEETAKACRNAFILRDLKGQAIDLQILELEDREQAMLLELGEKALPMDLNRLFRILTKCLDDLRHADLDRFILENYCLEWCFDPGLPDLQTMMNIVSGGQALPQAPRPTPVSSDAGVNLRDRWKTSAPAVKSPGSPPPPPQMAAAKPAVDNKRPWTSPLPPAPASQPAAAVKPTSPTTAQPTSPMNSLSSSSAHVKSDAPQPMASKPLNPSNGVSSLASGGPSASSPNTSPSTSSERQSPSTESNNVSSSTSSGQSASSTPLSPSNNSSTSSSSERQPSSSMPLNPSASTFQHLSLNPVATAEQAQSHSSSHASTALDAMEYTSQPEPSVDQPTAPQSSTRPSAPSVNQPTTNSPQRPSAPSQPAPSGNQPATPHSSAPSQPAAHQASAPSKPGSLNQPAAPQSQPRSASPAPSAPPPSARAGAVLDDDSEEMPPWALAASMEEEMAKAVEAPKPVTSEQAKPESFLQQMARRAQNVTMATPPLPKAGPAPVVEATPPGEPIWPDSWRAFVDEWKKQKPLQGRVLEEAYMLEYTPQRIRLAVDPQSMAGGKLLQQEVRKRLTEQFVQLFGFKGILEALPKADTNVENNETILTVKQRERDIARENLKTRVEEHPMTREVISRFGGTIEQIELQ